jgi:hypothetical protein
VGLNSFQGRLDLIESILLLAKEAEGEIFFISVTACISLVHSKS